MIGIFLIRSSTGLTTSLVKIGVGCSDFARCAIADFFVFAGYSAVDVVPVPGEGRIKIRGYTECKVNYDGYYTRLFDPNLEYVGK